MVVLFKNGCNVRYNVKIVHLWYCEGVTGGSVRVYTGGNVVRK